METKSGNIVLRFSQAWQKPIHIAPLAAFRIVIGLCMFVSTLRFMLLGWIEDHYIHPKFHFKYFGFSWIEAGNVYWQYFVHILLLAASLFVLLGLFYRIAAVIQFLAFTYTELIDLTYYLNHYYYVSIVCFLLILVPAHHNFSLDSLRNKKIYATHVPAWCIYIFMLQIGIVYTYAGLAKINPVWLLDALPLKIWLPASYDVPVLGSLFAWKYAPYVFSWAGMLYDSTITLWLLNARTRPFAYITVIVFHTLTSILFQIGVFPLVMIAGTLIFFSAKWHLKWLNEMQRVLSRLFSFSHSKLNAVTDKSQYVLKPTLKKVMVPFLLVFFLFQILFPWRYLMYNGNLFWTEEGYRFGWRVMLMEKAGTATFYVKDTKTGKEGEVFNNDFLNNHQEKQMAMQPDMILQYASFLAEYYEARGVYKPKVRAEVYVTLNGKPSKQLIDPYVDLSKQQDGWQQKKWVLSYNNN